MAIFVRLCAIKFLPRDFGLRSRAGFRQILRAKFILLRQSKRCNITEFYLDLGAFAMLSKILNALIKRF